MEQGYHKIIWGLFLATFHINFITIPILPAFIGWMIILSGANTLFSEMHISSFRKARNCSLIIFLLSIVLQLLIWISRQNEVIQLFTLLHSIFYLLFIYDLLGGSIQYLFRLGEVSDAEHYTIIQRVYIILSVINTIIMCTAITIASERLMGYACILWIVITICLMINIRTIKNIELPLLEESI